MKLGERLTVKLCVQAGLCASACSSRRHVGSWGNPSPTAQQRWGLGTLTHLLDGGLQGDVQVVHPRQLHRLVNALGCQRVSSEDGVGVPGKQHRVIFVSPVQQGKKGSGSCSWAPVHGTEKHETRPDVLQLGVLSPQAWNPLCKESVKFCKRLHSHRRQPVKRKARGQYCPFSAASCFAPCKAYFCNKLTPLRTKPGVSTGDLAGK